MLKLYLTSYYFSFFSFLDFSFEFSFSSLMPFSISFLISDENFFFFMTVMIISFSVFIYSKEYMNKEKNLKRFFFLLFLFVLSMVFLIFSSSLFSSFIGWDFLGLSSLLLILFYQSHSSLKAGVLTFVMNRLGDCFFIICLIFYFTESMNAFFMKSEDFFFIMGFVMVLTGMTKSAQVPFSSWLPAAMQAPTPVSSLVHSSTLVTAGFFLLFRYSDLWMESVNMSYLYVISLFTTILASTSALFEVDIKKIIALSTLSHLGFMMMILSMGLMKVSFFYMMMHAYFKALLFMCAGVFIHSESNIQDIRKLSSMKNSNPIASSIFSMAILSMSGFPYLTGFFSKDLALDSLFSDNYLSVFSFLTTLSAYLTMLYSFRISFFLLPSKKSWNEVSDDNLKIFKPMLPLILSAIIMGEIFNWIYLDLQFFVENSKISFLFYLMVIFFIFWKNSFFWKLKLKFLKMFHLPLITNFLLSKKFFFLKKEKIYEDLRGVQGMYLVVFLNKLNNCLSLQRKKKISSFFLGSLELFLLAFFLFILFI